MRPPLGCSKEMPDNHLSQAPPPVADHLPNDTSRTYPDLAAVVEAWPNLPEAIKDGIVAMVKAGSPERQEMNSAGCRQAS